MAKPVAASARPQLLVVELWGLGDLALSVPFLRSAVKHADVTLLGPPTAHALLKRFVPEVRVLSLRAPWTAFSNKYALRRWPWATLQSAVQQLRASRFDLGVSARPDPRDHLLLRLSGSSTRIGFPRAGSGALLTRRLPPPPSPHRAAAWSAIAGALGWEIGTASITFLRPVQSIVIHPGAAQPVRRWPIDRFETLAQSLRQAGYQVEILRDGLELDQLATRIAAADAFIGNDSGPGHLAALLEVPTFTLFGPQQPERFHPVHPQARWIDGKPCPYKPCFDRCRFPEPHCMLGHEVAPVFERVTTWLGELSPETPTAAPVAPPGAP